jgi:opacity protein-like surface antigen
MRKLLVFLLMSMVSGAALAATGAYITGDVGPASYGYGSSSPIAVRFGGGYNFLNLMDNQLTIGAEGGYANFGSSSNLNTTVKTTALMGAGIASYKIPNVQGLSAFGKVGVIRATTDFTSAGGSVSSTKNGLFIGIGAKYVINAKLAVRAQYEHYGNIVSAAGATSSLSALTGGVIYSF